MKILALEFSSPLRSVAVYAPATTGEEGLGEASESGRAMTESFRLITQALHQAGVAREEIECVAVGLGPGSYNGIRVAIAMAQGWQLARAVKVTGIDSATVIAEQAAAEGVQGDIGVVIDAQRGEFYIASYRIHNGQVTPVVPVKLATRQESDAFCSGNLIPIGPEVTRWYPHGRIVVPRASILARLAMRQTVFVQGSDLTPVYLRETTFVKAPPPRVIP